MAEVNIYKKMDSASYKKFKYVAENFSNAGKLAFENEYFNAAGLLIIHAAIALADAITIKLASKKSAGENHYQVISLLKEAVPHSIKKQKALDHFKELIDHKNSVSYSGDIYHLSDIYIMLKHFERFASWRDVL